MLAASYITGSHVLVLSLLMPGIGVVSAVVSSLDAAGRLEIFRQPHPDPLGLAVVKQPFTGARDIPVRVAHSSLVSLLALATVLGYTLPTSTLLLRCIRSGPSHTRLTTSLLAFPYCAISLAPSSDGEAVLESKTRRSRPPPLHQTAQSFLDALASETSLHRQKHNSPRRLRSRGQAVLPALTFKQQFINAKIVPDVIPSFSPTGLLTVNFNSTTPISDGEPVPESEPQKLPIITVAGITNSLNLHYLQNNVVLPPALALTVTPSRCSSSLPTSLAHPLQLLTLVSTCLATYVAAAGLTGPFVGMYFTVKVSIATVSVESTSAVNTATLSVMTSSGASYTGTGSSSSSTTTQSKSGVMKVGPAAIGGSIMGLLGMAALLA
ncbi:hypothetical protein DL93DRAFT_2174236 [Clavulina sp. PMI_390]|nr:hypothetical protein DL93DRAFT_2174236 [Clavulina sp. PMI_390]